MSCLDHIRLSDLQRAAVLDGAPEVLVAAGAGSGKTSLLVAYFLRALLDDGLPLDRLVAVTFTRKAAGEMVERIREKLEVLGRPDLARSLDSGAVGTIHSLCRRLLREHALEARVDPAFAVVEADAADLLKREAAAQAWEEAVLQADDGLLATLAENQKTLQAELVAVYDALRAGGVESPRIELSAAGDACSTARQRLRSALLAAREGVKSAPRRTATMEKVLTTLDECLRWSDEADFAAGGLSDLDASRDLFPTRIPALECHLEPVREALTCCRNVLAQARLAPLVDAMNDLLARLHRRYVEMKSRRGVLDFLDLELKARALISRREREGMSLLGPGARVMIDEFQDTNELQCAILEGLGADAVLMVGDECQSIYRFRGAEVEVFSRRRRALLGTPQEEEGGDRGRTGVGPVHRLDVNYRSCGRILSFINHLFAQEGFFGAGFARLECDPDRKAEAEDVAASGRGCSGAGQAIQESRPVEVLVVARACEDGAEDHIGSIQEAEAEASAQAVSRLVHEEGWRQGDVVILLPALTHADLYQEALRARGLEYYLVRGKGYYSREEVADIRSLLQVLFDPHDDLALVTVLRSPLVELSDDALYLLGRQVREEGRGSLWEAVTSQSGVGGESVSSGDSSTSARRVPEADRERLRVLRDRLIGLRGRVGRPGLARLIDDAVTCFGYDVRLLESPEGRRRFANLRKLMRLADEYEALHGPDVPGFVQALEAMGDLSDKEGSAATLAEGEDVIRIMTIHQAKGLEFPVVILGGLGSDVPQDTHGTFAVDRRGRVAVFLKSSRRLTYEQHDLCWGPGVEIVEEGRRKAREEDVRLLYVAMTRAKERLLLVGARPKDDNPASKRVGRVVQALGVAALPANGSEVLVAEAGALVRCLSFSDALEGRRLEPVRESGEGSEAGLFSHQGPYDELTPVVDRLDGAGTSARIPHAISFSGLSLYRECPRRFYLERLLGLRSESLQNAEERVLGSRGQSAVEALRVDEAFEMGDAAVDPLEATGSGRDVGLMVHGLLERLPLAGDAPSVDQLRVLAGELTGPAGAGEGSPSEPVGSHLSEAQLSRAFRLTQAFWSSPCVGLPGLAEAGKEVRFTFLHAGLLISGVMDLVWRHGAEWFIVDYKTNALQDTDVAKLVAHYRLQAEVYCLAALRAGAQAVHMDLLFLERPDDPVRHTYRCEDEPMLSGRLDEALAPLLAGDYSCRRTQQCTWCPVAWVCSLRG
jgi:ATP-dependent exoDNAse (exonuclease V) beta subunit